jgi:membrane protease YdiL (CAAX protease family)
MAANDTGLSTKITKDDRLLAIWEIVSVVSSLLITEWVVLTFAGNSKLTAVVPLGLALILMLLSHRARKETAREIGWRVDNFGAALRLLLLPMLGAAILILIIGWLNKSLRFDWKQFREWLVWLPVWGLIQQYVLQGYINRRAQLIWGKGAWSVLLVALIFAVLHLPNPWLALTTFAGGVVWAATYQRAPNLPALALSHGLMSLWLAMLLPSLLNSLRVGFKYFG